MMKYRYAKVDAIKSQIDALSMRLVELNVAAADIIDEIRRLRDDLRREVLSFASAHGVKDEDLDKVMLSNDGEIILPDRETEDGDDDKSQASSHTG